MAQRIIVNDNHLRLWASKVTIAGKVLDPYYTCSRGDTVMIIPVTNHKMVVLIDEYKAGADRRVLQFPAGKVGDRNVIEAASAELREETGYLSHHIQEIGRWYVDPSWREDRVIMVLARYCTRVTDPSHQGEDIAVIRKPIQDFSARLRFEDPHTAIGATYIRWLLKDGAI